MYKLENFGDRYYGFRMLFFRGYLSTQSSAANGNIAL